MKVIPLAAAAATLLLGACATAPSNPALVGSWKENGVSVNGNVSHAIDTASIQPGANQTVSYRERLTVRDPEQEHYANTPHYKTALNEWQLDCRARTYRLMAVQMFDDAGKVLAAHRYQNIRPQAVVKGSASGNQFEQVCGQKL